MTISFPVPYYSGKVLGGCRGQKPVYSTPNLPAILTGFAPVPLEWVVSGCRAGEDNRHRISWRLRTARGRAILGARSPGAPPWHRRRSQAVDDSMARSPLPLHVLCLVSRWKPAGRHKSLSLLAPGCGSPLSVGRRTGMGTLHLPGQPRRGSNHSQMRGAPAETVAGGIHGRQTVRVSCIPRG